MRSTSTVLALKALVYTIVILCMYFLIQLSVISLLSEYESIRTGFDPAHNSATGFMLSVALLVSVPACVSLTLLFMNKGRGLSIPEHLSLLLPDLKTCLIWISITAFSGAIYIAASYAINRPLINDFMLYVYETTYWLPLFIVSTGFLGPLFEELIFREFLFRPLADTAAGAAGSIAITSLLWAAIHVQYGLFDIAYIFILGLAFGTARHMTGSLVMPYIMHAFNNLFSVFLVTILRNYQS